MNRRGGEGRIPLPLDQRTCMAICAHEEYYKFTSAQSYSHHTEHRGPAPACCSSTGDSNPKSKKRLTVGSMNIQELEDFYSNGVNRNNCILMTV